MLSNCSLLTNRIYIFLFDVKILKVFIFRLKKNLFNNIKKIINKLVLKLLAKIIKIIKFAFIKILFFMEKCYGLKSY